MGSAGPNSLIRVVRDFRIGKSCRSKATRSAAPTDWCTNFYPGCSEKGRSAEGNRAPKRRLMAEGSHMRDSTPFLGGLA